MRRPAQATGGRIVGRQGGPRQKEERRLRQGIFPSIGAVTCERRSGCAARPAEGRGGPGRRGHREEIAGAHGATAGVREDRRGPFAGSDGNGGERFPFPAIASPAPGATTARAIIHGRDEKAAHRFLLRPSLQGRWAMAFREKRRTGSSGNGWRSAGSGPERSCLRCRSGAPLPACGGPGTGGRPCAGAVRSPVARTVRGTALREMRHGLCGGVRRPSAVRTGDPGAGVHPRPGAACGTGTRRLSGDDLRGGALCRGRIHGGAATGARRPDRSGAARPSIHRWWRDRAARSRPAV